MKVPFLLILTALFGFSSAEAGLWDSLKKASKEVSKKAKKKKIKKRRRTSAPAAVRGLGEDDEVAATRGLSGRGDESRDYESLDWLESLEVSDDDVNRFMKEGRLAP